MQSQPSVFAIDFGTSNSLLAAASADAVFEPVPLDDRATDPTVLASAIYCLSLQERYFGVAAPEALVSNGFRGRLIRSIKRHLPSRAFTSTRIGDRRVTLPDLIGVFLAAMRERACRHFGCEVDRVLLGRPALFSADAVEDRLAQDRLAEAAAIAGFRSVRFCPEPVAAAYDMAESLRESKIVLIADLGGGTSDFTVVRLGAAGFQPKDVLAIGGISIAGDMIDGAMVRRRVASELGSQAPYRLPMSNNVLTMPRELVNLLCSSADLTLINRPRTLSRLSNIAACLLDQRDSERLDRFSAIVEDGVGFQLFAAVEACKRRLSELPQSRIELDYPGATLSIPVTRPEMESDAESCVAKILDALDETLRRASLIHSQIDLVCATGGTSRMPMIRTALAKKFPKAHFHELSSFHSVVKGLALHARELIRTDAI